MSRIPHPNGAESNQEFATRPVLGVKPVLHCAFIRSGQRYDSFYGGMGSAKFPTKCRSNRVCEAPGGKVIPETDRIIRSFFVTDIRDLPRVASTERQAPLGGHAHYTPFVTGEHGDAHIGSRTPEDAPRAPIRAAEYVRMSTEHQKYSTENQSEIIRRYAEQRGFTIVRTYEDSGKSGLRIDGRDALKRLIDDVRSGAADFRAILVYDVSRWGRFQDADESAYYEFICKEAGITVHYCAEQFENDGSLSSTIIKSMKRAMAGEYSRELSAKVFTGQCRLIGLGFRQGGMAGYGLRRQLIDEHRQPKGELAPGSPEEPPDGPRHPGPWTTPRDRDGPTHVPHVRRRRSIRT